MRSRRTIQAVEAHTEGLPVRVVTGGVAPLPGATMAERRERFIAERDDLRRFLVNEPRGHGTLSGAILQPATRPDADWGVLFIEVTGVLPMCGAGTMAVATVLVETGMVEVSEPVTEVRLDTPVGLITVRVEVQDGEARSATIVNVPSFLLAADASVEVPGLGSVTYDMAYGGNFYAIVDAESLGLEVERGSAARLTEAGTAIMRAIERDARPVHPVTGYAGCEHVVFLAPGSDAQRSRHALINSPGWLDRSPGGTGTSARMAQLHARGQLGIGDAFVNESFIGTSFTGRLVEETREGGVRAVRPEVTGRAWITGTAEFLLDPADPFPHGYTVE
ncbi:proline racemase family protein [Microbacterium excoecariae]|uniref:proline racemase family protein n=1 Tax=Microbacterium excoecariae TaxID=2715210 RepID=UPI00140781B6|nr:proline racemase family protein [Microbacterium excoecariae]NHI15920.1 proline racemase family protein [Microbacterium excoecariae]